MKIRTLKIQKKAVAPFIITAVIILIIIGSMAAIQKIVQLRKKLDTKIVNPIELDDQYVKLINALAQENIIAGQINYFDKESLEASLSSGIKVIFSLKKDMILQAASLQLMLSRFRIEGRKVKKIDLRFKNVFIE